MRLVRFPEIVLLLSTVAAGACGGPTEVVCTSEVVPAIRATALDASSKANITSGAYLVVTQGTYKDSVGPGLSVLAAAPERSGVFNVRVGHAGYFPFTRTNVVVAADECHPITVNVQALLNSGGGGPN